MQCLPRPYYHALKCLFHANPRPANTSSRHREISARIGIYSCGLALSGGGPPPRVINVDGHPAYPSAIAELKQTGELGRRCRCRTAPYLNNIIEQDH